jgi:hypothetical protein
MRVKSVVPPTFFRRFIGDPVQLSPIPIGDPVQLFRDPAELHAVKISRVFGAGERENSCQGLREFTHTPNGEIKALQGS